MSEPKPAPRAKLMIAIIGSKPTGIIVEKLSERFGPVSQQFEQQFNFTGFYSAEMGEGLKKQYLLFENDFPIELLPEAKHFCYRLEKEHFEDGKRTYNIDPGYMTSSSIVLATFKHRPHRLYLKDGVYADLEMVYENKTWKGFPWTFPDLIAIKDVLTQSRMGHLA